MRSVSFIIIIIIEIIAIFLFVVIIIIIIIVVVTILLFSEPYSFFFQLSFCTKSLDPPSNSYFTYLSPKEESLA